MEPALISPQMQFCPPAGTPLPDALSIKSDCSKSYSFGAGAQRCEIFLTHKDGALYAYVNDCPHIHSPLDWQPDRFLNRENTHIKCGTHGALFELADGRCIEGPCVGRKLTPVPISLTATGVVIGTETEDHRIIVA